uniref:Solute carrier family 10 member 6 n=1 Tax=Plectus sambesii TaxID=2011161 RepID=A0A914WRH7_9BILA
MLRVFGVISIILTVSGAANLDVYVNESDLVIYDGETTSFLVTFTLLDFIEATDLTSFPVDVMCEDADLCRVDNTPLWVDFNEDNRYQHESLVNVTGLFLGRTSLVFGIGKEITLNITRSRFQLRVLRNETLQMLNTIFTIFLVVFVTFNTFLMGTQLNFGMIMRAVKKPVGCAIGFGCQYTLMPMIAYATALVVLSGYPSLQFGFFAVGCSPGGGQSNMYTILLGGNIDLSVTMTFFSTAAALGMMPLWITLVGQSFYTYSEEIKIPFYMIFSGLAGLIVPSAFGMLLIHYKPDWAKTCKTIVKILSLLM